MALRLKKAFLEDPKFHLNFEIILIYLDFKNGHREVFKHARQKFCHRVHLAFE